MKNSEMSLHVNVPEIAITPEAEEDDDNNFLNLADALTDIEELYDENVSSRKQCFRKKLKIKVVENDGYNTALEDVEASDDEDITIIKRHTRPIALDNLDMEQFSAEENYGITKKDSDEMRYMNLQSSLSRDMLNPRRMSESQQALTDVEDYDTENEIDEEDNIPEIDIHLDSGESTQTIKISDEIQQPEILLQEACALECPTPHTSTNFPISLFENPSPLLPRKKPPTFSQIMKGRAKCADNNKMRRKKRNKCTNKVQRKESDGSESSDKEIVEPRSRRNIMAMNSLHYESDMEEENKLPFPLCKKTFKKKKNFLQMPEFDTNNITDVEDVECETDISRRRVSVDGAIFQKQLDEMASCYSFTKDKNEAKEELEGEPEIVKINNISKHEKIKSPKKKLTLNLTIPTPEDGGHTDVENIASSDEENESQINSEVDSSSDTEEENFRDDRELEIVETPDAPLPPATRLLIIAEENKSLIPTVRILPLVDPASDSEIEVQLTEDECFNSDGESDDDEETLTIQTPQIPVFEGGSINVSEDCIHTTHKKQNIEETLTDIEDLDGETQKHKKEKRVKRASKFLIPDTLMPNQLTDVEDLDMSDDRSGVSLLSMPNSEFDGLTDVENLETTDDEANALKSNNIQLMAPPALILPGHTDTEDVVASTDDEVACQRADTSTPYELTEELDNASSITVNIENSSKIDYSAEEVMYLKGGGFQEVFTDTEDLDDINIPIQGVMEAWEYFNPSNDKTLTNEEWHAAKEDLIVDSKDQPTVREETKVSSTYCIPSFRPISYESVLLMPESSSQNEYLHKINSYHQIDAILEKMLNEVEQCEAQEDEYVSSLALEPSSDALIEIPINKRKKRNYTAMADIYVSNETEEIEEPLIQEVESEEDEEPFDSEYKYNFLFGDPSSDLQESIDTDSCDLQRQENYYEPISPNDQKDIWWEGTYRNLSVVFEEDEDNWSQVGSKSEGVQSNLYNFNNRRIENHENLLELVDDSSVLRSSVSTDDSDIEYPENITKAEIKLLVRSHERDLNSVEVKSVRDFVLTENEADNSRKVGKFTKFTNRLSNTWNKQKSNTYSTLNSPDIEIKSKKTKNRAVFTLPRLFLRKTEKDYIIAKPNENFPLALNPALNSSEKKVDLYANVPFSPTYNLTTSGISHPQQKIQYMSPSDVTISEAYCDWSIQPEISRGETSVRASASHDSSTLRDDPRESSSDKPEGESRSQPFDQHQLSEEMKELLKEMEKSSKQ